MEVTRIADAKAYDAPRHVDCKALRLQGYEASGAENFWAGITHFLPGGGCEHSASALEKVYICTEGEVTIVTDAGEVALGPLDSCRVAPDEARSIVNRTNLPASLLVVMPYPPSTT